jgi:hypothetical protein
VPTAVIPGACALDLRAGRPHCDLKLLANLHRRPLASSAPAGGYGPSDLQSAYDLPSGSAGGGQTVAIVDAFDDSTAEADLATHRSTYGLPPCTTANGCFKKVNQNGVQGSYPSNNQALPHASRWVEESAGVGDEGRSARNEKPGQANPRPETGPGLR